MKNIPNASSVYVHQRALCGRIIPRAIRNLRGGLAQIRGASLLAGAVVLVAPLATFAQGNAVRTRVTDRVDLARLTTLSGNTHALARAQYDQGAAPPDLPMDRIMLVLKRGPDEEAALQDLLVQQQIASSPSYHKWLTPDQFGQQFGPADADIQAVTSWLASFGFQSIKVSKGRTVIEFSGTASQVETALHTPIHRYVVNGEAHWANANDPQIPLALAPVVAGFASLHNFPKKPASVRSARTAALTRAPDGKPLITFTDGSHGIAPADFNTIYNVTPSGMTGTGVTIGVIARSNINVSDVQQFRSVFGLPANNPQIKLNGPDPGDLGGGEEAEAVLDATWPGAVAPNATVDLVVSESTNADAGEDLSEFYIIDNNLADVMTESFSVCEATFGSQLASAASFYSGLAEQAAAQGITYLVASGDSGPDGCDDPSTVPTTPTAASVNLLASTPFTVAVGGTQFNDAASPSTYWNSTNDSTTKESAKSYIPENVWNESCTVAQCGSSLAGLWSSGGGQSIAFTKPPWQAGVTGIPTTNARFVPDVAMAAADHDGYVLCLAASCQNSSSPSFSILSGTSVSAQVFGGVMALVVQKIGARVGIANYALYKLAAGEPPTTATTPATSCDASSSTLPASACIFNDVTVGDTNIPEVNPLETGFKAGIGYDKATGLGSVNVTNLVNQWHTAIVNASKTTLTLNGGNPISVVHGTSVPVSVIVAPVAPATGAPTGDVSLVGNSLTGEGADFFTLTPGTTSSTASWSTVFLPGGNYQVKAHYEGDGKFAGSDSAGVTVNVTAEASKTLLGIVVNSQTCATATSISYGSPYVLTVTVLDSAGTIQGCFPTPSGASPTGTITLMDSFNGGTATALDGGSLKLNSGGYFEDQTIQLPVGVHTITASYGGDNSFSASGPSTDIVTVGKAATTTSVSASPTSTQAGQQVTLTATVSTQSNATANASQEPTGTVQFLLNGSNFGSAVAVTGGVNANTMFAQAVSTLSTTTLATGSNVITAQYSGDSNYSSSVTTSSVTVTVGAVGINLSSGCSAATITISAPGQSGTCLITVSGANGFAGTVTLSSAVSGTPPSAVDVPTCSFGVPGQNFTAPNTITLTASSTTGNATMTCSSTAASGILLRPSVPPSLRRWPLTDAAISLIGLFLLFTVRRQRQWGLLPFAVLLVVVFAAAALTGCGSSNNNSGGNPGTTTGTYTFKVSATPSTGSVQTTSITVNVN